MSTISEDDLRLMIREAIAKRGAGGGRPAMPEPNPAADFARHASHLRITLSRGSDEDGGACLIEPAVKCNHCAFCQSFGH